MQPETTKRLHDALAASEEIRVIADSSSLLGDDRSRISQLAIERLLVTVGEALNHAIQTDATISEAIPDIRPIIGLRNRVVHGYDTIRADIIWDIARNHIPVLIEHLESLLAGDAPPDP